MRTILILLLLLPTIIFSQVKVLQSDLVKKGDGYLYTYYYKDDLFNGIGIKKYATNQLRVEINYKNGKPNGLSKEWYDNGQLRKKINYTEDSM